VKVINTKEHEGDTKVHEGKMFLNSNRRFGVGGQRACKQFVSGKMKEQRMWELLKIFTARSC
jgi:hypothetical protein